MNQNSNRTMTLGDRGGKRDIKRGKRGGAPKGHEALLAAAKESGKPVEIMLMSEPDKVITVRIVDYDRYTITWTMNESKMFCTFKHAIESFSA